MAEELQCTFGTDSNRDAVARAVRTAIERKPCENLMDAVTAGLRRADPQLQAT